MASEINEIGEAINGQLSSVLDNILEDIGMGQLKVLFKENAIGVKEVEGLTDQDFESLGVMAIGDRVRLKQSCRNHLRAASVSDSPVIQMFKALQKKKKIKRSDRNVKRNLSTTRRCYLGWKHLIRRNVYQLVSPSHGGGQQIIDVDKDANLEMLEEKVLDVYFPDGHSHAKGLDMKDLNYYLASFSGVRLETSTAGEQFVLHQYFSKVQSYPVRIYLHTAPKDMDTATAEGIPTVGSVSNSADVTETAYSPDINCDSDEIDSGTPTITFNRRRRRLHYGQNTDTMPVSTVVATVVVTTGSLLTTTAPVSTSPVAVMLFTMTTPVATETTRVRTPPMLQVPSLAMTASVAASPVQVISLGRSTPAATETTSVITSPVLQVPSLTTTAPVATSTVEVISLSRPTPGATETTNVTSPVQATTSVTPTAPVESITTDTILLADENDELQTAIRESLRNVAGFDCTVVSIQSVLFCWVAETLQGSIDSSPIEVLIHRRKILQSTRKAIARYGFSFFKPMKIEFAGEIGDDLGGPKREFFRLLLKEVRGEILEGDPLKMSFQHNIEKLEKHIYFSCGQLLGWSLLHGGPGLPCMHQTIYKLMTDQDTVLTVDDVVDRDMIEPKLEQIKSAATMSDLTDISDWLLDQGILVVGSLTEEVKDKMDQMIIKNNVYYRIFAEIQQFTDGLNSIGGLFNRIKMHPDLMMELFVHTHSMNFGSMKSVYRVNFSPHGSNDRMLEEDTIYSFESFLQDCEDPDHEVALEEVLAFWTGATEVPPLGFDKQPSVDFVSDNERKNKLPVAHTCGLSLELPRGIDPDDFSKRMVIAVKWGGGFHIG